MMAFGLDSGKGELEGAIMCCHPLRLASYVRQAAERWSVGTLDTLTDVGIACQTLVIFLCSLARALKPAAVIPRVRKRL